MSLKSKSPVEAGDQSDRTQGHPRVAFWTRMAAPSVSLIILISAIALGVIAQDVVDRQADELLGERASELGAILSVSVADGRSNLRITGLAAASEQGKETFDSVAGETAKMGGTTVVLRERSAGLVTIASAGPLAAAVGSPVDPVARHAVDRARSSSDMVAEIVDRAGARHVVLAMAMPGNDRLVAYTDTPLGPARPAPSNASSPYRELNVAVYAGTQPDKEHLVLVSGQEPGSGSGVAQRPLQVGADAWIMRVSARDPLVGSVAALFPKLVIGTGVALALIVGVLISVLVRRRAYALLEESRENFFALVSHDIRAPLTAIQGFVEMIPTAEPDRQHEFVQRVQNNVSRLSLMVDNLLDHARLRAGAMPVVSTPFDLGDVTAACVRDLSPVLSEHTVVPPERGVVVMADESATTRVLANVLVNAAKYSPPGSTIECRTEYTPNGGRVSVSDHGRGIAPNDLHTIFEDFQRGSLAEQDGGSGLGLSSSYRLVELQGGDVSIVSELGYGTTVTVTLPRTSG